MKTHMPNRTSLLVMAIVAITFACASSARAQVPVGGAAVPVAPVAAAAPPANLWTFLGVPQIAKGLKTIGKFAIHKVRTLLPSNSPPSALQPEGTPPSPAVAEAKKGKAAAAAQKQDIAFLAGEGCSDCNPFVEEALCHALQNICYPEVQEEAARTIYKTSRTGCCCCNGRSCCSHKLRQQLAKIAYREEHCCRTLADKRASIMARRALCACCPIPSDMKTMPLMEGPRAPDVTPVPTSPADALPPPSDVPEAIATPPAQTARLQPTNVTQASYQQTKAGRCVARVMGEAIYESDVMPAAHRIMLLMPAEKQHALEHQIIRDVVNEAIETKLLTRAARDQNFAAPRQLAAQSLSSSSQENALAEAFLEQFLSPIVHVEPAEVERYFAAHRNDFIRPAAVKWRQVTAYTHAFGSREEAYNIAKYYRDAAKKLKVAAPLHRRDQIVFEEGDWVDVSELAASGLLKEVGELRTGEISDVTQIPDGYRVYGIVAWRPEQPMTFQEAEPLVRQRLLNHQRELARSNYIQLLRRAAGDYVYTAFAEQPPSR